MRCKIKNIHNYRSDHDGIPLSKIRHGDSSNSNTTTIYPILEKYKEYYIVKLIGTKPLSINNPIYGLHPDKSCLILGYKKEDLILINDHFMNNF